MLQWKGIYLADYVYTVQWKGICQDMLLGDRAVTAVQRSAMRVPRLGVGVLVR